MEKYEVKIIEGKVYFQQMRDRDYLNTLFSIIIYIQLSPPSLKELFPENSFILQLVSN